MDTTASENSNAQTEKNPLRGELKVAISTSEPVVTVAGDFSIYVVISNPYDVPLTIYSVKTHIPNQLVDSIWLLKYRKAFASKNNERFAEAKGIQKIAAYSQNLLASLQEWVKTPEDPRIAQAVGTSKEISILHSAPMHHSSITVDGDFSDGNLVLGSFNEVWKLEFPTNPTNEELDRLFMKIEDYKQGNTPVVLYPGNSEVKHFVLRAKRWLFFTPIAYTFQIQTRYAIDGVEQTSTSSFNLQIYPALQSIIVGAIAGSLLGSTARSLGAFGAEFSLSTILLATILGAIAVVAFARKANAQQIVSVEDFWGGLIIGFLVGYLGESYFRGILGT